jgi:hypothetical protein
MAEQQGPQPVSTGGVQIGHWGGFQAYVPGFRAATSIAADAGPVVASGLIRRWENQQKAAKDYDDSATMTTQGSDQGQPVQV